MHLKGATTDSTVVGNVISGTGLVNPQYGEGIYIGTHRSNWCRYNGCQPDRTVRNAFVGNTISGTTAEAIEAKELAIADSVIANNMIDGAKTTAANASSTLVKVKGNRFTVRATTLSNSSGDAVLVLKTLDGTGQGTVVLRNEFRGRIPGYGFRINSGTVGNVVGCDNAEPHRPGPVEPGVPGLSRAGGRGHPPIGPTRCCSSPRGRRHRSHPDRPRPFHR